MSVKERAIQALQELPDDADYQALAATLDFIRAVDEGLADVKAGRTVPAEEARKRLSKWLSE